MKNEKIEPTDFSIQNLIKQNRRLKKTNYFLIGYVFFTILIMLYNLIF